MSMRSILLRVARAAVEQVTRQIADQMSVLEDAVRAPMQAMVNEVVGGVWVGDGADKFVDVVTSINIPGTGRIVDSCNVTTVSITRSLDIVESADEQVRGIVNDLESTFRAIY